MGSVSAVLGQERERLGFLGFLGFLLLGQDFIYGHFESPAIFLRCCFRNVPGNQRLRLFRKNPREVTISGSEISDGTFTGVVAILWNISLGFSGISILIVVGVALETMKQIESQLMMRNYEGFLT